MLSKLLVAFAMASLAFIFAGSASADGYAVVTAYPFSAHPTPSDPGVAGAGGVVVPLGPGAGPNVFEEPPGGGGGTAWSGCLNVVGVNSNYSIYSSGGYDIRVQVNWCAQNGVVTSCYQHRWIEKTDWPWEFVQWTGYQLSGGSGTDRCGAWTQAQMKETRAGLPDDWEYPCIQVVGYNNGSYVSNQDCGPLP